MKKIYTITLALISALILGGCSDYLDTKPGDKYDDNTSGRILPW